MKGLLIALVVILGVTYVLQGFNEQLLQKKSGQPYYQQNPTVSLRIPPQRAGQFVWPVAGGRISRGLHDGDAVDIAAPAGTAVYAAAAGTVVFAGSGWNHRYGTAVVIAHTDSVQTLYAHLSRINVTTGQQVFAGQQIGAVGDTGDAHGFHLHFGVSGVPNPFAATQTTYQR